MKRFFSLMLTFVLALSVVCFSPTTAFAQGLAQSDTQSTISSGADMIAFIKNDYSLWMWGGANQYGQLGLPAGTTSSEPVKVLDDVYSVCCGQYHVAAIKTDGTLWTWGINTSNELGNPDIGQSTHIPTKVTDGVKAVYCTNKATFIIKEDNSLWACGNNGGGLLGLGRTGGSSTFTIVETNVSAVSVANDARANTGAIVKSDNSLWLWGYRGQINIESLVYDTNDIMYVRKPVKYSDGFASVSCGMDTVLALTPNGDLYGLGRNELGELGDGGTESKTELTYIMSDVRKIQCGFSYGYALKNNGDLYSWGARTLPCALGDNEEYVYAPTGSIVTPRCILDSVTDMSKCLALKNDGTLWAWGSIATSILGDSQADRIYRGDIAYYSKPIMIASNILQPFGKVDNSHIADIFSDVSISAYYYDAVVWAKDNGVTDGVGNNQFSPDAPVDRAQMVTFLWKLNGRPSHSADIVNPFNDVKESDWFYDAVMWAYENHVTDGTSATTFSPKLTTDRSTVITFLWKQAGSPNKTGEGIWYNDAVRWANDRGVLFGTAEPFTAKAECPRSDIVFYMYKDALL